MLKRLGSVLLPVVGIALGLPVGFFVALLVASEVGERQGSGSFELIVALLLMPVITLAGGALGGIFAHLLARPSVPGRLAIPQGQAWFGHYPAAWLGGAFAAILGALAMTTAIAMVVSIFGDFSESPFAFIRSASGYLTLTAKLGGAYLGGRSTMRYLDWRIHTARMV
jgi:hypothetical protein